MGVTVAVAVIFVIAGLIYVVSLIGSKNTCGCRTCKCQNPQTCRCLCCCWGKP